MPYGGIKMAEQACETYGYHVSDKIKDIFNNYEFKTHNQGVFDIYTPEMKRARHNKILTGLPDTYGRGRIVGDYRRVALYGVNALIKFKQRDKDSIPYRNDFTEPEIEHWIRFREEHDEQIKALKKLINLGNEYGLDLSRPAQTAQEAVQWTYMGYLASIKSQDGAAMSFGRNSAFLDCYIERDLQAGKITETDAQELIDNIVMKLRIARFLRTKDYDSIFSGDPYWATWSDAGFGDDGRSMVTKTSFRLLNTLTLEHLGPGPEPNITIFWDPKLPEAYKRFCAKIPIDTSAIQYESDKEIRSHWGDDAAIACCVSPMRVGKQMQFFGARANLAKCLLYALNGGVDEVSKKQVGPKYRAVEGDTLDYDDVVAKYNDMMKWLAGVYVNSLNIIHYMHDKYCYERIQMALHDKHVHRWFATGIAGLSVVADSLSAIKYAKVHPVRDENGIIVDFETEGEFPKYGNDDDRVDQIAHDVVHQFMEYIRMNDTYRNSVPTTSVLTITSNVVYGKKTGSTPDGPKAGQPGANPMHKRDSHGAIASLSSVSKLPFRDAQDGISNTFSIIPSALGKEDQVFFGDIDLDQLGE